MSYLRRTSNGLNDIVWNDTVSTVDDSNTYDYIDNYFSETLCYGKIAMLYFSFKFNSNVNGQTDDLNNGYAVIPIHTLKYKCAVSQWRASVVVERHNFSSIIGIYNYNELKFWQWGKPLPVMLDICGVISYICQ